MLLASEYGRFYVEGGAAFVPDVGRAQGTGERRKTLEKDKSELLDYRKDEGNSLIV